MNVLKSFHDRKKGGSVGAMGERKLHMLCHEGVFRKVKEYVDTLDQDTLKGRLTARNGVFGYTPIHEAVASRSAAVLRFLLGKAQELRVDVVNIKALNGYTPLHLATSQGDPETVVILLQYDANIHIKDDYEKTPLQTAELGQGNRVIVNALRSEELIREVSRDGERVTEILKSLSSDVLERDVLNKCLISAVKNDNSVNIGKLVIKGAKDIQFCLEAATKEKKLKARAMLLLIIAASTGDTTIIQHLYGETVEDINHCKDWFLDDDFKEVQKIVQTGTVSTVVAIEMARRCGNSHVREALILKTDVREKEGTVSWHGLRLLRLEDSWLEKITWVKSLRLHRNGLKVLPENIGHYLRQVVKLGLHYNELVGIPASVLQLPSLVELNLSHNQLSYLPTVSEWASLVHLDVSYNLLTSLPSNAYAPYLQTLNLSNNNLSCVPLCIASFRSLSSLDLSYNDKILSLPVEMGRLTKLTILLLEGVERCDCKPQNTPKDIRDCVSFLNSKRINAKEFFGLKVVVLGEKKAGKSTLVRALKEKEIRNVHIEVTDWQYRIGIVRKTFHFNIWDFSGDEQQHDLYRCFFSKNDLYVVVFDLTKGPGGLQGVKKWLEAVSSTDSCTKIIIVGTHLDEIPVQKRHEVDARLQQASALADSYRKCMCKSALAVGLKNSMESLGALKDEIYMAAASYKKLDGHVLMGQKVAASYHTLARHMETVHQEVLQGKREPVMKVQEFKATVKSLNLTDICYDEDVIDASIFLDTVGLLTFYNDHRHSLHQFYFLDPHWLSNLLFAILIKCIPLSNNGIVRCSDVLLAFLDSEVQSQLVNQCLVILARNLLILPLSKDYILLPSRLQESRPEHLPEFGENELVNTHSRHILFVPNVSVPKGFWGTVLQWAMKAIPELSSNLTRFHSGNEVKANNGDGEAEEEVTVSSHDSSIAADTLQFDIWQCGLHYSDSEVMLRVEALETVRPSRLEKSEGVLIVASPSEKGRRIVQTLLRSVVYIIKAWYPALDDGRLVTHGQKIDCPQCLKLNKHDPFQFVVENVLRDLSVDKTLLQCGYHTGSAANHTVNITDVIISLLQQDEVK